MVQNPTSDHLIWPRRCPKICWIRGKLDVLLCCLFGLTDWHGNLMDPISTARSSAEPDDDEAVLSSFVSGLFNGSFAKTPIKSNLAMLNEINTGFITKKSLDFHRCSILWKFFSLDNCNRFTETDSSQLKFHIYIFDGNDANIIHNFHHPNHTGWQG